MGDALNGGQGFSWAMGTGRAFSVQDPTPDFVQRAIRTVAMRNAAKSVLQGDDAAAAGKIRPAFDAVITASDIKVDGNPLNEFVNLIFAVTRVEHAADAPWSPDEIVAAANDVTLWAARKSAVDGALELVNCPKKDQAPLGTVRVTDELLTAIKGCGIVTVAATEALMHAGVSVPLGAAVWATTVNLPVPVEDIIQQSKLSQTNQPAPAPAPVPAPRQVPPPPPKAGSVASADDCATQQSHDSGNGQWPRAPPERKQGRDGRVEVSMGHTQMMEQQAWLQARGAYSRERLHRVDPDNENSTQHVVTALATAAELHFVRELQPISSNWAPAKYRAWTLAEFRPASLAGTANSCRIAWFAPGGSIEDMAQLWAAVAVWTEAEIILRGPHMGQIMEAFRALTVLDIKRNGKLGWASILHVLEARAMTLRSPPTADFGDDNPTNRALCAFSIRPDDRDVKAVCDVPILAPYQPARGRADANDRYVPYTISVTDRKATTDGAVRRRNPSSMGSRSSSGSAPSFVGNGVPERFRRLEGTCYEWVTAGQPQVNQRHPCPSSAGHRCSWDHFFDNSASNAEIDAFIEWCQRRARAISSGNAGTSSSPSTTSGAAHRRRKQGRAGQP